MKTCRRCLTEKPDSEFHLCSITEDKLHSYCKECNRAAKTAHRRTAKGQALHRANMARYRKNNRHKEAMRARMRRALKSGGISKTPCEACGDKNVEAHHHNGYDEEYALDVVWLCRKHHLEAS